MLIIKRLENNHFHDRKQCIKLRDGCVHERTRTHACLDEIELEKTVRTITS